MLTPGEREVLRWLVAGATNKEIGAALSIAAKTVETRIAQICHKLCARSRTEAAVRAVMHGLVRPTFDSSSPVPPGVR